MMENINLESYLTIKNYPALNTRLYICKLCGSKFVSLKDARNHLATRHFGSCREREVSESYARETSK
jgi:hypothetical protein